MTKAYTKKEVEEFNSMVFGCLAPVVEYSYIGACAVKLTNTRVGIGSLVTKSCGHLPSGDECQVEITNIQAYLSGGNVKPGHIGEIAGDVGNILEFINSISPKESKNP